MDSQQFDKQIQHWLNRQPGLEHSRYHVQIKLWISEVDMATLAALHAPGWVVLDWQPRGLGLSLKRAMSPLAEPPAAAALLDGLKADLLHAQVQLVLAPIPDWQQAYRSDSLVPDLLPVLDSEHAIILSIAAQRESGTWHIVDAHQPPSETPIADFGFTIDD
jgi:hypothetical protein